MSRLTGMRSPNTFTKPSFTRRAALGAATTLGAGAALAACGGAEDTRGDANAEVPAGESTGTLRVGHYGWVGNLLEGWLPDLVKKFEEENDGVTVEIIPVASSETTRDALVQKLSLEARQGESSYDLLLGPTPWLEAGSLARAGAIHPVEDLLGAEFVDNIVDAAREECTSGDGKMYSIPFWADVVGFMDRPSLQTEHGLTAPVSWDDLAAQATADLPGDMYFYGGDWTEIHRLYLPILAAYAERDTIFADNGTIDMSSDAAVQALQILKDLVSGMPANAQQPGGFLDTFYANQQITMTYWQTGVRGSINQGIPEGDITYRENLTGDAEGTFFWDTAAVIPSGAAMPEVAARFMVGGFCSEWGMQQSVGISNTVPPMKNLHDVADLPPHLELAYSQLGTAIGMPSNDAFLAVMQPSFRTEAERMIAEDLAPADVAKTLTDAFAEYE